MDSGTGHVTIGQQGDDGELCYSSMGPVVTDFLISEEREGVWVFNE